MKQEVEKWRPFGHPDGDIRDLSFLDAHQAVLLIYRQVMLRKHPLYMALHLRKIIITYFR